MKTTRIDTSSLAESSRMLKAFADPVRLRLLNLLSEDAEICVCHLHEALELPQPTVSRHLAYLRKTGLVNGRKEGLWVHYRLVKARSKLHANLLNAVEESLGELETFRQDRRRLERLIDIFQTNIRIQIHEE